MNIKDLDCEKIIADAPEGWTHFADRRGEPFYYKVEQGKTWYCFYSAINDWSGVFTNDPDFEDDRLEFLSRLVKREEIFEEAHRPYALNMVDTPPLKKSKYHREIKPGVWVDVYDVLEAFDPENRNSADDHAIKKMLLPGKRGQKDGLRDRREAIQSLERSLQKIQEKAA